MQRRLGFIGIIIENREKDAEQVNHILSQHAHIIIARTGIPYKEKDCAVITLAVDATTDEVGKLTGQLGQLSSVSVKSALSKKK
ncbi:MAG: CopG family transcriptional regulator [bacterium]|nr:CopG family transcriptional regulator [bacterium]